MKRAPVPLEQVGDLISLGLEKCASSLPRVLIVGDGNFSFTRAWVRANLTSIQSKQIDVTATSLDTKEELLAMYPKSETILSELQDDHVHVLHDVNATKLQDYAFAKQSFDRLVFNFPHYAENKSRHNKIHRHRQLLRNFFASANEVLDASGQIWVTLCGGQGGTPSDIKQREWGDHWQIASIAASYGFILLDAHRCPVEKLQELGYGSVGYQLREQAFWTQDAITHVFCRESTGQEARYPLEWTRHMSFWVHEGFTEEKLKHVIQSHFPSPLEWEIERIDTYNCPKTGRTAVTYKLEASSRHTALSREDVNKRTEGALVEIESSDFASSRDK